MVYSTRHARAPRRAARREGDSDTRRLIAFLKDERPLPTIVALAFLVRLLYCVLVFPRIGDALHWRGVDDGYDELARNVLGGHGYAMAPGRPGNLLTPPGYAYFLSGLYAAFGVETSEGPRLWVAQAALDAITCGILYAIGGLILGDRRTGLLAALAWALYPQMTVYSARIAPEVLFTLLFVLLFVAWLALERRGGAARALLAGALWAALALTKEKAVLLPLVLLARLLWVRRAEPRHFAREAAAFALAAALVLSPWIYRGYRLTGGFVPITLRGGRALAEGIAKDLSAADTDMIESFERNPPRPRAPGDTLPALTEAERDERTRLLRERESSRLAGAFAEIARSPVAFARKAVVRLAAYWYWGQPRVVLGNALVNVPLLVAAAFGLRAAWGTAPASVAILIIAYMNVLHALTVVRMRYSLPVMPLVILFAAYAVARARGVPKGAAGGHGMRILQATHQGDFGGSTNSITNLSRGLAARGHDVFVLARAESLLARRFGDGPACVVAFAYPRPSLLGAAALARIARAHAIDVVNCHASRDRYTAIWARLLFGLSARVVLTRRNLPLTTAGPLQSWLVARGADRIIAVSARVKERLVAQGIPDERVAVVHNGIPVAPIDALSPERARAAAAEVALAPGRFAIGVVARLKDQGVLLEALARLPADITVLFLGIDAEPRLVARARALGLAQDLRFLGFRDDPLPFYPLFTVMVLPSSIEGFSLSILEAMAFGVPVVASDAGGNAEAIVEGETGFTFPPEDAARLADAIRALHGDRARARAMGERARARVRAEFSIERTVERTEAVYRDVLGLRSRP